MLSGVLAAATLLPVRSRRAETAPETEPAPERAPNPGSSSRSDRLDSVTSLSTSLSQPKIESIGRARLHEVGELLRVEHSALAC